MSEFVEFPKMARLSRQCIVTEKIDGTNAAVVVQELDGYEAEGAIWQQGGLAVFAQSRTRFITPQDDNYGFAAWVLKNAEALAHGLGPGRHFGEWWGQGIQRGYGLSEKRFSLFNVARWCLADAEPKQIPTADPRIVKMQEVLPVCCGLVPVLREGVFNTIEVEHALADLRINGSRAAPGFMRPEGVVVFHVAGNVGFKKTLDKDDEWKGKSAGKPNEVAV